MTKILYGNICLQSRSGTEVVTLETVRGLHRLGHEVAVLVSRAGSVADELRTQGIPVLTSAERLPWRPEIVHANHLHSSLHAAKYFPNVPQIFVCHDPTAWHSGPARLHCVRRYCAVDRICAERAAVAIGIPPSEVHWLPNAVDLSRFPPRGDLPPVPRRALLVTKNAAHAQATQAACEEHGITLDRLGAAFGLEVDDFGDRLQHYDLVFAAARTALESLAAGCAVIVVDGRGLAGMANSHNIDAWRPHNLGKRILTREPTTAALSAEIATYDAADARRVSEHVRRSAGLDVYLPQLVGLYETVLTETRARPLRKESTQADFCDAFCTALPNLLAGLREGFAEEEIVSLAEGLPGEFGRLWQRLAGPDQRLLQECVQFTARIAALHVALAESTQRAKAAELSLASPLELLRRLVECIFPRKRESQNRAA